LNRIATLLIAASVTLAGCADTAALEQRLTDAETKIDEMQAQLEAGPAAGGEAAGPSAAETAAGELLRSANDQVAAMNYEGAKTTIEQLTTQYRGTRAASSSRRMAGELAVIGRDAGDLSIEDWYVGDTSFSDGKATLVVFWETWCPHCRREVPKMQETWETYQSQGLNMVGLTRLTKTSTEEAAREFVSENNLTYPIGKEDGSVADRFGVRGIPAAAVVKDGKIVWRGHPARITDAMFANWLDLPS
jgi:peroxiredoxin